MKMKTFSVALATLLLALGTISCNQARNENEDVNPLAGLTFKFSLPAGDPVFQQANSGSSLRAEMIQDAPEWTLEHLWLYEFVDGKLNSEPIDLVKATTEQGTFKQSEAPNEFKYTFTTSMFGHGNTAKFYFAANIPNHGMTVGDPISKFQTLVLNGTMATNVKDILKLKTGATAGSTNLADYVIPMTGVAKQGSEENVVTNPGRSATVELIRAVARIDVNVYMPGFKLIGMELYNTNNKSILHNDYNFTNTNPVTSQTKLTTAIPSLQNLSAGVIGNRATPGQVKKGFYLYEQKNDVAGMTDQNVTYVKLKAEFPVGTPWERIVPFKTKATQGTAAKYIDVKRNHIYYINIGDKKTETTDPNSDFVSFTISDQPWNVTDFHEQFTYITATGTGFTSTAFNGGEIKAPAAGQTYTLTFTSDFVNHATFTANTQNIPNWITVQPMTTANKVGTLSFTVAAQPTTGAAERKATIAVTSNASTSASYLVNITQPAN